MLWCTHRRGLNSHPPMIPFYTWLQTGGAQTGGTLQTTGKNKKRRQKERNIVLFRVLFRVLVKRKQRRQTERSRVLFRVLFRVLGAKWKSQIPMGVLKSLEYWGPIRDVKGGERRQMEE